MQKNTKLAACYCVYDDFEFLQASVESIVNYVDAIYFFVSFSRYDGQSFENDNETTLCIISKIIEKHPKCKLIRKDWKDQLTQRNEAIEVIERSYDYCLIIDADEIWDDGSISGLIHYMKKHPNVDVFTTRFYTYYKSLKYRITPIQNLKATTLIKTKVRLTCTRGTKGSKYIIRDIPPWQICWHHPSHVRSDIKMKFKMEIANHEYNCRSDWFEKSWLNWTPEMIDFHPEKHSEFHQVIEIQKSDLPTYLHAIFDNEELYLNENLFKKLNGGF
jgi:hypothetical protein